MRGDWYASKLPESTDTYPGHLGGLTVWRQQPCLDQRGAMPISCFLGDPYIRRWDLPVHDFDAQCVGVADVQQLHDVWGEDWDFHLAHVVLQRKALCAGLPLSDLPPGDGGHWTRFNVLRVQR